MKVRIAKIEDTASLVAFNQAMALETEGKTLNSDILTAGVSAVFSDEKKGFYVVAEENGEVAAGLMVTHEWSDWRNGWFWWIQSVYVRPEFRGTGLYGKLYEFVKAKAAEAGNVCGFRLYVEKENEKAQRVYEKLGMHQTYYLMYENKEKPEPSNAKTPVTPMKTDNMKA
ncbi:MAG TPA: GNAT family N-acetyltransferase [Pyrinomonadaceae bacterium]|nr:GNAT family N-acetyltransferase [Pyrinomonadaceae bacterium]